LDGGDGIDEFGGRTSMWREEAVSGKNHTYGGKSNYDVEKMAGRQ
jgi:hypothetical protein